MNKYRNAECPSRQLLNYKESMKQIYRAHNSRELTGLAKFMAWLEGSIPMTQGQIYVGYVMVVGLVLWMVWEATA